MENSRKKTFYKIRKRPMKNSYDKAYWAKKILTKYGEGWENLRGGWCLRDEGDEILKVVAGMSEEEFTDKHRREVFDYLINPDSEYGWLAPDGTFYGCSYASHEDVAVFYFGEPDELDLEKKGWVKIFLSVELGEPVYAQTKVSYQQRIWLEDHAVKFHYC